MKHKLFMILFLSLVYISGAFAQLPPLIDREVFFGDPEIAGAQLSPDGKYISFLKPFNNILNIWVKERDQSFDEAKPITADTLRPVRGYFWSRDSKYVLYVQDKGGDENYRIYAVDPSEDGDPVPPAKDLTPYDEVRAVIYDVPLNTPDEIIIGLNDRDAQLHDVYRLNIVTGERNLMWENNENVAGWSFDLDGNLRLGTRITEDGGTEILDVKDGKLVSIYKVGNEETAYPVRFSKDGKSFYLITDKGDIDKSQLELFNLETGETELVEKDPLNEVDIDGAWFSDLTNEILATYYTGAKRRVYPHQEAFKKSLEQLESVVPEGDIFINSMSADENLWLVGVTRDIDPGSTFLFDRKTGEAELLYKSRPKLPTESLAPMKPVSYKARDGLTIPAYLTLPKGIPAENLPTVIFVHGGPWARDYWGYDAVAQFLANRGYAVLQPNFRGSSGYGKKFLNAGNKEWGTGAMQHDITDGVKYLIDEGISDPERIGIAGGSYGGYATLAGLAFTPDLYAAGFDIVGPSNIITLLNSIPPYWAPVKKIFDVRVGNQDDPEEKKMLEEQSPLFSAKEIKAPLFVAQGANDPRVKKAESDQIVVALRDLGRQVEYMVAPDEGHGYRGKENRLAMFTAMEEFLAKYLDGRVQEDVSPEIQKRLDAIMVDINTVELPKAEDEESLEMLTSFDGSKIKPATLKYAINVQVQGQEIKMDLTRNIAKATLGDKEAWRVIDEATGMMGGVDTLDVDANTLLPLRRSAKQGMATVKLSFAPDAVEGEIVMGQQTMPMSLKLDSPALTDGAGVSLALSSLAFADDMKASFNQIDIRSAKIKPMKLAVLGSEPVETDAGSFDTYKVEVKSQDGEDESVIWFDKETKNVVKSEIKLGPEMGGGTVTVTLTK